MKSLNDSSLKAIRDLKALVEKYITDNGNDVQALDAFLDVLEDQCQSVNTIVDILDNQSDAEYEAQWEAHRHE